MKHVLKRDERLPGEEIISETPYRPFSVLVITNKRVIGKRLFRVGLKQFEGVIYYDQISNVTYGTGIPLLTVPSIVLEYKQADGIAKKATIRFLGFISRLVGYDPKDVYYQIAKRMNDKNDPDA
jgi:hypothetical protein